MPVQLGGAPTMGNLAERFAVLVLVPLVDEDQEPQQFFAGQRYDVKCVRLSVVPFRPSAQLEVVAIFCPRLPRFCPRLPRFCPRLVVLTTRVLPSSPRNVFFSSGVSAVQAWKVIPGAASAASSKSRGKKRKGGGQSQGQPPDRAPERRSAEEMAEPPEYAMNPQTPRGVRHRNGGPADSSQVRTPRRRPPTLGRCWPGTLTPVWFSRTTSQSAQT